MDLLALVLAVVLHLKSDSNDVPYILYHIVSHSDRKHGNTTEQNAKLINVVRQMVK